MIYEDTKIANNAVFWTALYLDKADPSGLYKSKIPVHEGIVADHVNLCGQGRLLNVFFGLKCNGNPASLHERLWTQLIAGNDTWGNVLVSANTTCRADERCLHSMIQGGILLNALRLQNFAATRREGQIANCGGHNDVTLSIAAQTTSITIAVPAKIISWAPINLKLLDIHTKADDTMWCRFFESCPSLEVLVWRRDGPVRAKRRVVVPSLHVFQTRSVTYPPPILAPNLLTMIITDGGDPFTASQFKCLVGISPVLEHLDMLANPTRNMDVEEIFRISTNLVSLAVSTTETRSTLYGTIATRAQSQYIKFGCRQLQSVQFARGPPMNARAVTARKRYEALCRVAFKVELNTITFEPRAERLGVRYFPGDIKFGEDAQAELISANGMDPQMTRLYDQDFDPFRPDTKANTITLIILTLDADGARSMFARGWYYKGLCYRLFRDRPPRDSD
ncbi:hypothetical protein R3P38DRAFT_3219753 [Favolaschia claudopus]|uniref:Uncharacterized protein n=1 Tax=Favolaschia claudopus TaxID=2862362 RepID=A0AAW0A1Y6_9AGAR